ncbi:hypothetical protein ASF22_20415 [Methylobacterium sp. Leaf87]|nr:hypothetical protein ASF22_20415 [Methylobacterium sp. Leaf87]
MEDRIHADVRDIGIRPPIVADVEHPALGNKRVIGTRPRKGRSGADGRYASLGATEAQPMDQRIDARVANVSVLGAIAGSIEECRWFASVEISELEIMDDGIFPGGSNVRIGREIVANIEKTAAGDQGVIRPDFTRDR